MADTTSYLSRFLYRVLPKFFATTDSGVSGVLDVDTTAAQTGADTVETTLWSYTLPANTLSVDGQCLKITAWGTFANTASNTRTIKGKFGATTVVTSARAQTNDTWLCEMYVIRTSATAQKATGTGNYGGLQDRGVVSPAETLSGTVTIVITGQNGAATAGDITYVGSIVQALN